MLIKKIYYTKIGFAIILLLALFVVGLLGYSIIAGLSLIDALYMTTITISTVGYKEVQPFDENTKIFTIVFILGSTIVFAYLLSVFSEFIIKKNYFQKLKIKRMNKKINTLKGHIIICGFGRNGKEVVDKMRTHNKNYVLIEKNISIIENQPLYINGDATQEEALINAGIKRASCLITTLGSDADNLYLVLTARQLNQKLNIVSRALYENSKNKLILAGANKVIMSDKIGGERMAYLVLYPGLVNFFEKLSMDVKKKVNIEEIRISKNITKQLTIKDLNLKEKSGCNVIGYQQDEKSEYIINPDSGLKLLPNSKIVVLGRSNQINRLNELFNDSKLLLLS